MAIFSAENEISPFNCSSKNAISPLESPEKNGISPKISSPAKSDAIANFDESAAISPSIIGDSKASELEPEPLHLGKAFGKMIAFLAVIITLGGIMILIKRRGGIFMRRGHSSKIRISETLHLGTRHYLAVVEYENQRFLVGISSSGISKIGDLSETVGASSRTKKSFSAD